MALNLTVSTLTLRCPNGKAIVMEANSVTDFASYFRKLATSVYDSKFTPFEIVTNAFNALKLQIVTVLTVGHCLQPLQVYQL